MSRAPARTQKNGRVTTHSARKHSNAWTDSRTDVPDERKCIHSVVWRSVYL